NVGGAADWLASIGPFTEARYRTYWKDILDRYFTFSYAPLALRKKKFGSDLPVALISDELHLNSSNDPEIAAIIAWHDSPNGKWVRLKSRFC
ncbi:MAG TPA: hypothetical protein VHI52_22980, partial [Verrucomicrobiae bacterium]|nr:hypothetical protein [Verrucomicrobiae bacterium]